MQKSCLISQKWSTRSFFFLNPHLETPKDIATNRGGTLSMTQLYHRRDICPGPKNTDTSNLISSNTLYSFGVLNLGKTMVFAVAVAIARAGDIITVV